MSFSDAVKKELRALYPDQEPADVGLLAGRKGLRTLQKRACIRGFFLAAGSVAEPGKENHLEFSLRDRETAERLAQMLSGFHIPSKISERKNKFILYLKDAERVSDALKVMGCQKTLMDYENARIVKELQNGINRVVNCQNANMDKTMSAAMKQLSEVRNIESRIGLDALPPLLEEAARARLAHPECSLQEIGTLLNPPVGKSGVNHRFRKISQIADETDMPDGLEQALGRRNK